MFSCDYLCYRYFVDERDRRDRSIKLSALGSKYCSARISSGSWLIKKRSAIKVNIKLTQQNGNL